MTAQIPAETLADLRALLAAATPGPWKSFHRNDDPSGPTVLTDVDDESLFFCSDDHEGNATRADADLAAEAVTALPALLDALAAETARAEAAEAKVARVRAFAVEFNHYMDSPAPEALAAALADQEDQ